ncbi:hypothetical protein [Ramlibacter tataouinensis]|uniref:Candidate membrane protein n=1 Tax=Ramlibacter tataouinensis (strain ATCC BAA-407 / DSM 14655 / LMG 21543 / TTB310) TaxID=365046 RepID=F5XZK1_RAMTT|nr:hypothetical protein [Ramlibacter tataouinensis]AEG92030.1 candidate membrane protein [Ramlibacter tataouinensis TTB310]
MRHKNPIWLLPALGMLAAIAAWLALPAPRLALLLEEGQLLENLTVWAWGAAVLVLLALAVLRPGGRATALALALVSLLFAARELDLHKDLTGTSVLRVSWYLKGPFTAAHALSLAVLAAFAAALLYLVWRHGRTLWRRWRQGEPAAAATVAFLATLVLSKLLDRTASVLAEDFGLPLSLSAAVLVQGWEEVLELVLPLVAAVAAAQQLWRPHKQTPGARAGRSSA